MTYWSDTPIFCWWFRSSLRGIKLALSFYLTLSKKERSWQMTIHRQNWLESALFEIKLQNNKKQTNELSNFSLFLPFVLSGNKSITILWFLLCDIIVSLSIHPLHSLHLKHSQINFIVKVLSCAFLFISEDLKSASVQLGWWKSFRNLRHRQIGLLKEKMSLRL